MNNKITTQVKKTKTHNFLFSSVTKFIALSFCLLSLVTASFGIYSLIRNKTNPREGWSKNFATTSQVLKNAPEGDLIRTKDMTLSHSIEHDYDLNKDYHYIEFFYKGINCSSTIYEKDSDAKYNRLTAGYTLPRSIVKKYGMNTMAFTLSFGCVNGDLVGNFIIDVVNGPQSNKISYRCNAPIQIVNDKRIIMPYMEVETTREENDIVRFHINNVIKPGTSAFNTTQELCYTFYPLAKTFLDLTFYAANSYIPEFPYVDAVEYINDLQNITLTQRHNERTGYISLFVALPIFFAALILFLVPLIYKERRSLTATNTYTKSTQPSTKTTNEIKVSTTSKKSIPFNVTLAQTFIVAIVSLSMIILNLATSLYLYTGVTANSANLVNNIGKNLLIASLVFAIFFGCVYINKKDKQSIKGIIIITALVGTLYYLFTIVCCHYFVNDKSSSGLAATTFAQTIPDNIFIPLSLALLAYYCLFKAPKEKKYLSISIGAIAILTFSCFVSLIAGVMKEPYYLTALISPNLTFVNAFIVGYLIVLHRVSVLSYRQQSNISYDNYLNSEQHIKNNKIIATIVIAVVLLIANLICPFFVQSGNINVTYNIASVAVIPIILLYKNNQKDIHLNKLMFCLIAIILLGSLLIFSQSLYSSINAFRANVGAL